MSWCRLGYKETVASVLHALSFSAGNYPWEPPYYPTERPSWHRIRAASDQQPARPWSPQPNSHVSDQVNPSTVKLGNDRRPSQYLDYKLCETLSQRTQLSCAGIPDSQKLWCNKCLLCYNTKVWNRFLYINCSFSFLS